MASVAEKNTPRVTRVEAGPLPPIVVGGPRPRPKTLRWTFLLLWFMRVVSLLWMFHSVLNWGAVLGIAPLSNGDVTKLGVRGFTAAITFAGIDPVAAVGLWLATAWGGIVWLFAVAAQMVAVVALPKQFGNGVLTIATDIGLVVCYLGLSFAASREGD